MCKVFGVTETKNIKNHKKFTDTILKNISKYEGDGLGFEYISETGERFGQKGTGDALRFNIHRPQIPVNNFTDVEIERFGVFNNKTKGPAIFHGRTSTNDINLNNTHPLRSKGYSLIHNGVVTDHGPKYMRETTNDTEHLLNYIRQKDSLKKIQKNITGYYACLVLNPDNTMHIFLDNIAPLYTAWCSKLETWVFSTCADTLERIWTELGYINNLSEPYKVKPNYSMVWNGNQLVSEAIIKPRGYGYKESKYASASLGRSLSRSDYKSNVSEKWGGNVIDVSSKSEMFQHEALTKAEIDFAEYIRDHVYASPDRFSFVDETGKEYTKQEIDALTNRDLLDFSMVDREGHSIDINNFDTFDKLKHF